MQKTNQELKEVDESLDGIRTKLEDEWDKLAEAKMARDKSRAQGEIHRLNLIIGKGVKNQERLKTKLTTFDIQKKVTETKLEKLKPRGASSSSAAASTGAGRFKLHRKNES